MHTHTFFAHSAQNQYIVGPTEWLVRTQPHVPADRVEDQFGAQISSLGHTSSVVYSISTHAASLCVCKCAAEEQSMRFN